MQQKERNAFTVPKQTKKNLSKEIFDKIQNDFGDWKIKRLLNEIIPNSIKKAVDKIFNNDQIVLELFKTFDEKILNPEKIKLYSKISDEIYNYIRKNDGEIEEEKIEDLIAKLIKTAISDSDNPKIIEYLDDIYKPEEVKEEIEEDPDNLISEEYDYEQRDLNADAKKIIQELKREGKTNINQRGVKTYIAKKIEGLYISKNYSVGYAKNKFVEEIFNIMDNKLSLSKRGWSKERMLDAVNHKN